MNACKIIQVARKLDIGYSVGLFEVVACKLYRSVWAFSCSGTCPLPERVPHVDNVWR